MTAVNHAARIAEVLCREVHPWLWEELSAAPCDECTLGSQALAAAGIGVLPEAEVTEPVDFDVTVRPEPSRHRLFGSVCTCGEWRAGCGNDIPTQWAAHVSEHVTEWEVID